MEQMIKKSLSIALLISAFVVNAQQSTAPVVSQLRIRPQSLNGARKVAGETPGVFTHVYDNDGWYSNFSLTPEYQRSFFPSSIAHSLFGNSLQTISNPQPAMVTDPCKPCKPRCVKPCAETILIQGSGVKDRNPNAWRAEDFYLSREYNGSLSFKPVISNFILDFNYFGGLSNWVDGMYFRVYAPYVHTKWNLNMTENITSTHDSKNPASQYASRFDLPSASSYFVGNTPPSMALHSQIEAAESINHIAIPITRNPLLYDTMTGVTNLDDICTTKCGGSQIKNGFGEIRGELGWDFWQGDDYHVGLYLAGAAPTGTRPRARLLFEPQIGNGKHWELGGGITAHWAFWSNDTEDSHVGLYFDAMVTHLFKTRQRRVFDLKNKPMSRYMLAAQMDAPATNELSGTPAATDEQPNPEATRVPFQFANVFTPVANLTAQDVNVSIGAQVDLTAWFNYTGAGFSVDLGYNLWAQSCEKFGCVKKCGPRLGQDKDKWVLVGDAIPYGITEDSVSLPQYNQAPQAECSNWDSFAGSCIESFSGETTFFYPLSFSESQATMTTGMNKGATDNSLIDAPQLATVNGRDLHSPFFVPVEGGEDNQPIYLSNPPTYLNSDSINMNQASRAVSHKIFGDFGYVWQRDRDDNVITEFNLGFEVEFGSRNGAGKCCPTKTPAATTPQPQPAASTINNKCCPPKTNCPTTCCMNGAISQWGVWAKFNIHM